MSSDPADVDGPARSQQEALQLEASASGLAAVRVEHPLFLRLRDWQVGGRFGVLFVWIAMIIGFSIASPSTFPKSGTIQAIVAGQQPLVFLAIGLVVIQGAGEFDLSFAAVLGLAATLVAQLVVADHYAPIVAILIALGVSVLVGLLNGYLVVYRSINPIVVTLGMSTLLTGVALQQSNLTSVSGLPNSMASPVNTQILGLPISFYYGVVLTLIATYVLFATRLGRHMMFVGANREVARLAGVRVNRMRVGAFVTTAFVAGLGGVIVVAGLGGYDPTTSQNYLLPAFAATFLGSAMIVPGRFNPIGACLAIYFLQTGIVGLQLLGVTGWITDVFFGGALIIAVAVSQHIRRNAVT
jgi:ribose transport system permease protein